MMQFGKLGHFVSTRQGGASLPPQNTLNLSFRNHDKKEHVTLNRHVLANAVGISDQNIITANQVHGTEVAIVSQSGSLPGGENATGSDALVTGTPGICLMILTADCVPVLLYDPEAGVVGAVHAGWKGTLGAIVQKTVQVLEQTFASKPRNMYAGIGPSIGPCCFEVGPEVLHQFEAVLGPKDLLYGNGESRGHIDLWTANARQLIQAGVPEAHIEQSSLCTCHHVDTFFSHRCEGGKTGRFGTGIFLNAV